MAGDGTKLKRYTGHALGILAEIGWILGLAAAALLMAVVAEAIWP